MSIGRFMDVGWYDLKWRSRKAPKGIPNIWRPETPPSLSDGFFWATLYMEATTFPNVFQVVENKTTLDLDNMSLNVYVFNSVTGTKLDGQNGVFSNGDV